MQTTLATKLEPAPAGTLTLNFLEGPAYIRDDVHVRQRFFTRHSDAGTLVGKTLNVMFTIDRPAKEVWGQLKDFNLWQNSYEHYYSEVVGDSEGKTFRLSLVRDEPGPHQYKVVRVIPEHLIVIVQPLLVDGSDPGSSPDCHVFLLNEHGGKTTVTALMEHAIRVTTGTVDEAVARWQKIAADSQMKWVEYFIPTLKKRVYGQT